LAGSNWSFLYLVQERHFTVLESGWLASLPPLGAALGAGIGGGLGFVFALLTAVAWLGVDASRPLTIAVDDGRE
jgi:hypothetical protein